MAKKTPISKKTKTTVKKTIAKLHTSKATKTRPIAKVTKTKDIHVVPKTTGKITKMFSKGELYSTIGTTIGLSRKQIATVFDTLGEIIEVHLKKDGPEKFVLPGLLKIVVKKVPAKPAREGRNPFTGETMTFKAKPASKKVKVIALRQLKSMC
jgi:nucleoid DNA-binding protein